ncbi:hypothetical protein [Clostridium cibarium]|uniref:Acyl carrier protein n=1 Tax=Clostridium cibarium TaxID=2762247 RepID=A0ABR8PY20_9CLOT|nr:hypothetical protein [Clostridium cibarium]MBD7913065.1 hypothetical protein [Clostridium cibarium]
MVNKLEIETYLKSLLKDYEDEDGVIRAEYMDSFEFVQIMLTIEDYFDIEFDDKLLDMEIFENVDYVISCIYEMINCKENSHECV